MRGLLFATLIGVTLVLSGACSSLPDLHFDQDGGPGGPGGEGGTEGGPDPNCKPTGPEICDDGIDNDCNGKIDCQDSACTQAASFSCQDAPAGWTVVAFAPSTTAACPSGEVATDLKVVKGNTDMTTCSCACSAAGGSCTTGTYTLTVSGEATCSVGTSTVSVPVSSAGCTALGSAITVPIGGHEKIGISAGGPQTCNVNQSVDGPITMGRQCQAPRFGGGCGASQVCAPNPVANLTSCLTTPGKSACPAGFSKRSTAGTDATDSRTCTGCACSPPTPCSGGSVSIYDNAMCKANGAFKGSDGITSTCATLGDTNYAATHFKSTPPAGGGCSATPMTQANPQGGVSFVNERTVCCR